MVHNTATHEIF